MRRAVFLLNIQFKSSRFVVFSTVALHRLSMCETVSRSESVSSFCQRLSEGPRMYAASKQVEKRELTSSGSQQSQTDLCTAIHSVAMNSHRAASPLPLSEVLISELADDPDMAAIIKIYVGKFPSKIRSMREYLVNNRLDELARLAHQLKGTGGGYGFPSISNAAWRVEQEAKSNSDLQQLRTAVSELTILCQKAIAGCVELFEEESNAFGTGFDS